MTNTAISIRPITEADLGKITATHLQAFPRSALTRLGEETVYRYYLWQLTGPHQAHNIGAFNQDELVGFCFGGKFKGATGGFIRKERTFLIHRVLTHPWLAFNPIFRERLAVGVRILLNTLRSTSPSIPTDEEAQLTNRSYGILAIAVAPEFQGQGIGRRLMESAEKDARQKGFERMNLSVHPENQQAVRFYEGLAWQRDRSGGKWDGKMFKLLNQVNTD